MYVYMNVEVNLCMCVYEVGSEFVYVCVYMKLDMNLCVCAYYFEYVCVCMCI